MCFIYCSNHKYDDKAQLIEEQGSGVDKSIVINEGAWIGGNVTILPGVIIGEHAVVGAGSVVNKDVPEYTLFAGVPAKLIKKI
jgi:acetyltransferase-like isoleucine patch superfamily enzyme